MKKTMTLNLTDSEMQALQEICNKKEMSKTSVLRNALKLYQLVDGRLEEGDKLIIENNEKDEKSEIMLI